MIRYANLNESGDYNLIASGDHNTASMRPSIAISYTGSSSSGGGSTPTPAKPGRTIADGIYFIRNLNSGKYLDVSGASKVNGSNVIQHTFNRNENQQWNITYESGGYYRVSPVHAPGKALDMQGELLSKQNGTVAQIWEYKPTFQEQKWLIRKATGGGYEFITKASSSTNAPKVLEISNSSTANSAKAQIWTSSTSRTNDNWQLQKVSAEYYFTPGEDKPKMGVINPIIDKITSLGNYTIFTRFMSAKAALNRFGSRNINIVHGHGDPNGIFFATSEKTSTVLLATQPTSGDDATHNSLSNTALKNCNLMVFLSCNGGTRPSAGVPSMTEVAYNKGAKITLGFSVTVSMAEDYFNYVMNYVKSGTSFGNALAKADNDFNRDCWYQVLPNLSPATPSHRTVCGNQNIILMPSYWS